MLSNVGKPVALFKFKVGLGDNFESVGTDVFGFVGDGVKVNSVELIVGNIVIL